MCAVAVHDLLSGVCCRVMFLLLVSGSGFCWLLFVGDQWPLCVVYCCPLCVNCWLLVVVRCGLFVACCLLFGDC